MSEPSRRPTDAPVTLDEWWAALSDSVLGRLIGRLGRAVARAEEESRAAALLTRFTTDVDLESTLLSGGVALVVAMVVHVLLLMLQPYPYPGHSVYGLPAVLLAGGAALIACHRPIAAAWRDRAAKHR